MIELDEFKEVLPKPMRKQVTQGVVDTINHVMGANPEELEFFRENLYGYGHVLQEGKFKFQQYVEAVRYCTYKMMGKTNQDAYTLTFSKKYADMKAKGYDAKKISSYVAAYSKNKLVNMILDQARIAPYLYNMDNYQKTINTLMQIVTDDNVAARDRVAAGGHILTHLKPPEEKQIKVDINTNSEGSILADLRATTAALVAQQKQAMEMGFLSTKEAAESKLIIGEVIDD